MLMIGESILSLVVGGSIWEGAEGYLGQFAIQFFDNNFAAYGLA